jgi:hypothetical protein
MGAAMRKQRGGGLEPHPVARLAGWPYAVPFGVRLPDRRSEWACQSSHYNRVVALIIALFIAAPAFAQSHADVVAAVTR